MAIFDDGDMVSGGAADGGAPEVGGIPARVTALEDDTRGIHNHMRNALTAVEDALADVKERKANEAVSRLERQMVQRDLAELKDKLATLNAKVEADNAAVQSAAVFTDKRFIEVQRDITELQELQKQLAETTKAALAELHEKLGGNDA